MTGSSDAPDSRRDRVIATASRARQALARLDALESTTTPDTPLARLDAFMKGFDHTGTGDAADEAASLEEWAEIRETLSGAMRRSWGYSAPCHPLDACVWFRQSTGEWILEIEGGIGETSLGARHTQPGHLNAEDVPGLPALHALDGDVRNALGPVLDWYQPDEEADRPLADIAADVAADLSEDRAELLAIKRALAPLGPLLEMIRDRNPRDETSRLARLGLDHLAKAGLTSDPATPSGLAVRRGAFSELARMIEASELYRGGPAATSDDEVETVAGHAARMMALGERLTFRDVAGLASHDALEAGSPGDDDPAP
jgi:hypothetical protein